MLMRLWILVRALPGGGFNAASVDLTGCEADADDAAAAVSALRPRLAERIEEAPFPAQRALVDVPPPELVQLEVDVQPEEESAEPIVRLSLYVTARRQPTSRGELWVVHAPGVPNWETAVASADEIPGAVGSLAQWLRGWRLSVLLTMDTPEEPRLEAIEVPLPTAQPKPDRTDDDEDDVLRDYGVELTARAREGGLAALDRRDELLDRVLGWLASDGRSSVILVGPQDVGKTAVVHELARRLAEGHVPARLAGRSLWRISANELIAGARYSGMWQGRARGLVQRARTDKSILAMGDPAGIVDAGRWSKSDNNLARFLRPYVETGELTLICECTPEAFAAVHRNEPSFLDAFHRVDVPEPSPELAREIADAAARRLEASLGIAFDDEAVAAALDLTRRFEPYRGLPGKAVRLLEESAQGGGRVAREDVVATFTTRTGLPQALLSDEAPLSLADVHDHFEARVLGQPVAVDAMVELVGVLKAGLNDPAKPLGSFFFVGPTGVGKTELAKALAEFLFGSRERVVRLDMGEFSSGDAVQRLVGSSWGSDEGELTRRVREQPFSVVLLDEIEKAHRGVFDALLSALGEGRLTDAAGRTADFRNAIVIMTSNLGSSRRQSQALGFGSPDRDEAERLREHYVEQAERFFRPEFFNRLDRIVVFDALDETTIRRIARREVGRLLLREGIVRRRLLVEIDDQVVDALAERGFHPQYGARPLQREIERAIIQPLARLIVEQRPVGDLVRVHLSGGEIAVAISPLVEPERREARRSRRVAVVEAGLAKAAAAVEEVLERIEAEEATASVRELRDDAAGLIERTHEPAFWDEPEEARATLSRIYQVESVLGRLDGLRRRASGLAEMAQQMRRNRDRTRLPELRQALEELEDGLLVVRLELAGAATGGEAAAAARVRITPVGSESAGWAVELLGMYRAWAERTGRDASDGDPLVNEIVVEGLSSLDLLAGECGLHRRTLPEGRTLLARVTVTGTDATDGDEPATDVVVRVYEEGRRNGVRDPRTGARVGAVDAVLHEGRIDAFLLAALRETSAAASGRP